MYVITCRLMRHVCNYIKADVSACNYIRPHVIMANLQPILSGHNYMQLHTRETCDVIILLYVVIAGI